MDPDRYLSRVRDGRVFVYVHAVPQSQFTRLKRERCSSPIGRPGLPGRCQNCAGCSQRGNLNMGLMISDSASTFISLVMTKAGEKAQDQFIDQFLSQADGWGNDGWGNDGWDRRFQSG